MHFKKLELLGFKSFCDKTVLNFEPGVTAVVGPNGCGKCLRYDSLITLIDGSRVKIGDLVEAELAASASIENIDDGLMSSANVGNINIFSLNPGTLKIEARPVYAFIKRKAPEFLLEIKTRSGKAVVTTHYHPFFTIDDGRIVDLKAEALKVGVCIASPRFVCSCEANLHNEPRLYCSSEEEIYSYRPCSKNKFLSESRTDNALILKSCKENNLINSEFDSIPGINGIVKNLVNESDIQVKRLRKISPRLAAYYENRCLPTRQGLMETLSVVAEHGQLNGMARLTYDYLKLIADSDIYWDEVVEINKVYSEEWVYDLSILGNHNFIAQDMIVHNSNIFDSIRWVLGEQSAKSLRGSEMQDVIFNGTDSKEGVGMAEVSLTLDNSGRYFNLDNKEIVITRRLFRSGESEYLLNKTPARLKDIQDLLMGTGIGAESYSIVAQGKIDMVLSSRPEDRRLVFDEAAGITKYKAQKRETIRRLEDTEQNLLRVNDIIAEVRRQIGSLERQANKARKYREIFDELKSKETALALHERKSLVGRKEEAVAEINRLQTVEAELVALLADEESKAGERRAALVSLEENIVGIKDQVQVLENQILRSTQSMDFSKEKISEITAGQATLLSRIEELKASLAEDAQKLTALKEEYAAIQENINLKNLGLAQDQNKIDAIALAIKAACEKITGAKTGILELANKIANTKNQITDFASKEQVYQARRKRLEVEKVKVYEEKAIAEQGLSSVTLEVENIRSVVDDLNARLAVAKCQSENEAAQLNDTNQKIQETEKQRLALESHREFLEKLKNKYEDISESMNAVIYLDRVPQEKLSGLVVKIKDNIDFSDGTRQSNEPVNFRLSGEAKPVELDTRNINERIDGLIRAAEEMAAQRSVIEARIQALNNDTAALAAALRKEEINLANKETSKATISEQFNKTKEEEELIVMELLETEKEISILGKKIVSCRDYLAQLSKDEENLRQLIALEEESIADNARKKEEALVVITRTKAELEALNKRVATEKETLNVLENAFSRDKENLITAEQSIEAGKAKVAALTLEIEESAGLIEESRQGIEAHNKARAQAQEVYTRALADSQEASKKIDSTRKEIDSLKNNLHELAMKSQEIDYKLAAIIERMSANYKVDLEAASAAADAGGDGAPVAIDIGVLTQEISKLREKADSYGSVNLVAIEEYDELKKRYDFLVQQQADLVNAKESLHQAILKINRTTKDAFIDTFEKVKVEFRNYFRILFGGGDAQVYLTDEHDPLESGIEIICRPPGKKLQNVLLLSGGEKAMSAIALIFAIFKVKPSPFCILDEIDAALDEANVDRFSKILQEFIGRSQFIVITHNKKTIANANVMYGITMQNSGISRIVSVKFSENLVKKDKEGEAVQETSGEALPASS